MRNALFGVVFLAGVGAVVGACSSEAELPKYGPPGGLYKKEAPQPTGSPTSTGTGSSGVDAGPCDVSFKTQIHPLMTTGNWKCSQAGCHTTGGTPPPITSDVNATYTALLNQKRNGKPYINNASTDPAASYLLCNLKGEAGCGTKMPVAGVGGATAATAAELDLVEKWLKCGSPNN